MIIVVNKLDLTAEQAAARVNLLLPDLIGEQRRLAAAGEAAAQRHSEAYFNRSLLRQQRLSKQNARKQS